MSTLPITPISADQFNAPDYPSPGASGAAPVRVPSASSAAAPVRVPSAPQGIQPISAQEFFAPEPQKPSLLSRIGNALETPLISGRTIGNVEGLGIVNLPDELQKIAYHEVDSGNPWRANIAQFLASALGETNQIVSGVTSPLNLGVTGATLLTGGVLGAAIKLFAGAYFAYRGWQAMRQSGVNPITGSYRAIRYAITGKNPPSETPEQLQNSLLGLASIFGSAALLKEGGANFDSAARGTVRNVFGLRGDLAQKVDARLETVKALRGAQDELAGPVKTSLDTNVYATANRLLGETFRTVQQEYARVKAPFIDMAQKIGEDTKLGPDDVKAIVHGAFKDYGVDDAQIPRIIYKPIASKIAAAEEDGEFATIQGIKTLLRDLPENMQKQLRDIGATETPANVSFNEITQVRNSMWNLIDRKADGTPASAKDAALNEAYNRLTQAQENIADAHSLGARYRAAKDEYSQFQRELGVKSMRRFIAGQDAMEQNLIPKIAQVTTRADAAMLRSIFKKFGVDTSDLDAALKQRKDVLEQGKQQLTYELRKTENTSDIVPDTRLFELAGKNEPELMQLRLQKLLNQAAGRGISNAFGLMMMMYGSLRMAAGSAFGLFPLSYGAMKVALPELLLKPEFQNWLLREGDVPPQLSFKGRQGIADVYPLAKRIVGAANTAHPGIPTAPIARVAPKAVHPAAKLLPIISNAGVNRRL